VGGPFRFSALGGAQSRTSYSKPSGSFSARRIISIGLSNLKKTAAKRCDRGKPSEQRTELQTRKMRRRIGRRADRQWSWHHPRQPSLDLDWCLSRRTATIQSIHRRLRSQTPRERYYEAGHRCRGLHFLLSVGLRNPCRPCRRPQACRHLRFSSALRLPWLRW
jgi:hypothetical protein